MLARTTRNCPGRMNISPEQETSIIYVMHICAHQGSCLIGTHHAIINISDEWQALVARPCRREAAAKAGKVMRRRVGRVQMQHR